MGQAESERRLSESSSLVIGEFGHKVQSLWVCARKPLTGGPRLPGEAWLFPLEIWQKIKRLF